MSFDDYDERESNVDCPECGEAAYLDPDTGLCFDCKQQLEDDEGDEDDDGEVCIECGDTSRGSSSDAGNEIGDDGLCPECREALGVEE